MITDCPSCSRQFRIYAWQLSAAKGTVQCGFCGEQFNALERLHDSPISDEEINDPELSEEIVDEPQFSIPGEAPVAENHDDVPGDSFHTPAKTAHEVEENGQLDHSAEGLPAPDSIPLKDDDALDILGDPQAQPSVWIRLFWFSAVSILLVSIAIQIVWFNRDWILTRYPDFMPLAQNICERIECELVRERDIQSIIVLNRDVRDHPRYADTLLVNATIENQSEIIQPFPDLRLILFDTEGQVTGYRTFNPREYLDESINIESGMPVNTPVHIILELTGSTNAAVSFEFTFI